MRPWLRVSLAVLGFCAPALADSVAVIPFTNVSSGSNASNLDWIGESVAESLRETLTSKGLLALDRGEIREAYQRLQLRERAALTQASFLKLGEALDAEEIIHGTFAVLPI